MSQKHQIRRLVEALHKQGVELDNLLKIILKLGQIERRDTIVGAFHSDSNQ